MNKLWIIATKDIGEAFRSRSTYIIIIIMIVITMGYISVYNQNIKGITNPQELIASSRNFLNGLSYVLPMMFSIFVCSVFANYTVIVDKAKRNIESLMATPISIKQIWRGKTLAVALPSLGIGISGAIISFLVMDIGFVMPKTGSFIFPNILAVFSALILVPVLVFVIVSIVTYIQLVITNPRIGNLVFSGFFMLLWIGLNLLGGLGISTNFFALTYLIFIVVCETVAYILSHHLTKEKVLLSSKV